MPHTASVVAALAIVVPRTSRAMTGMVLLAAAILCVAGVKPAASAVDATAECRYKNSDGSWSKTYRLSVTFLSGQELNKATKSYTYRVGSLYIAAWFGGGQAAVIRTSNFASGEVKTVFGVLFTGYDQDGDLWEVRKMF